MAKIDARARHKARRLAMQGLYQWQMTGNNLVDIEAYCLSECDLKKIDIGYFQELLHQIPAKLNTLDTQFDPHLDRASDELGGVELAIIRIATYELAERLEIPYRVVINEALELAKRYGAEGSFKFINGVLDKVAKDLRKIEMRT